MKRLGESLGHVETLFGKCFIAVNALKLQIFDEKVLSMIFVVTSALLAVHLCKLFHKHPLYMVYL